MKKTFYWIVAIEKISTIILLTVFINSLIHAEESVTLYGDILQLMETEFGTPDYAMKLWSFSGNVDGMIINFTNVFKGLVIVILLSFVELFFFFKLLKKSR